MLKGHSKKRWKLVSSHCLLHIVYYIAHSYSLPSICSSSSSSLCLIDLWATTRRKICAYQDCMRTRARRLEVRLLMSLATRNRPFLWSRNLNSRCSSICLLCLSPSFFLVLQPGILLADLKLERIGERWTTSHMSIQEVLYKTFWLAYKWEELWICFEEGSLSSYLGKT